MHHYLLMFFWTAWMVQMNQSLCSSFRHLSCGQILFPHCGFPLIRRFGSWNKACLCSHFGLRLLFSCIMSRCIAQLVNDNWEYEMERAKYQYCLARFNWLYIYIDFKLIIYIYINGMRPFGDHSKQCVLKIYFYYSRKGAVVGVLYWSRGEGPYRCPRELL